MATVLPVAPKAQTAPRTISLTKSTAGVWQTRDPANTGANAPYLNPDIDYNITPALWDGPVEINGGRFVRMIGGQCTIDVDPGYENANKARWLFIKGAASRTVDSQIFVEGVKTNGRLREGVNVDQQSFAGGSDTGVHVVLQNIESADILMGGDDVGENHSDFFQGYNGPTDLDVHHCYMKPEYQAFMIQPRQGNSIAKLGTYRFSNLLIDGTFDSGILFYDATGGGAKPKIETSEVYVRHSTSKSFEQIFYPNRSAWDPSGTGVKLAPEGMERGAVLIGLPGLGYTSPGYGTTTTPPSDQTPVASSRRNLVTTPKPGRNLSKWLEYNKSAGVSSYADGDYLRIDNSVVADYGRTLDVTLAPGTYTVGVEIETLDGCQNAAFVVRRKSDFNKYAEIHVTSANSSSKRYNSTTTFTLTASTVVSILLGVGSYGTQSAGSAKFKNIMIEAASSPGTYFDGATADTSTADYSWLGAAHDSVSAAATANASTPLPETPPVTSPGTDAALELMLREVWKGYKHRYVRFDGAVLQREADNKVPSEATAYGMNMAVNLDDEETFELIESFNRNVLERKNWTPQKDPRNAWRNGGDNDPRILGPDLMAWDYRVGPFNSYPANSVNDWNFATDADVDRARALYNAAAKKWGPNAGQDYLNKALTISLQLLRFGHVKLSNGRRVQASDEFCQQGPITATGRTPGHHTFEGGGEFEMNISYIDQVFAHLSKDVGKNSEFQGVIDGNYQVLKTITDGSTELPNPTHLSPDWNSFNSESMKAYPLTAGTRGWGYSRATWQKYDGFRIWFRLRWTWDMYKDPEAKALLLKVADFYRAEWNSQKKIAAEYDLQGNRLSGGYDNTSFTAAAYLCLTVDPTNTANMTAANEMFEAELKPELLYATDSEGYKFWAGDRYNTGGNQFAYFGDSWMMFFFLDRAGLWNNFGQTETPSGSLTLTASETVAADGDQATLSIPSKTFGAEESFPADGDTADLIVLLALTADETSTAADEANLSVEGQPDAPAPEVPPTVEILQDRWVWVSRTGGDELELTHFVDGLELIRGASGLIGGPKIRSRNDYVPGLPGAVTRNRIHDVREITVPLVGMTDGYESMMSLVRRMVQMMDPVTNDGLLRYVSKSGRVSELSASVIGGLEVDNLGDFGPNGQAFAIILEAVDPYWYSDVRTKTFGVGTTKPAKWFPFPPLTLSPGSVLGEATLDVESDVPTWPVWTIVGPGRNLSLANLTGEPRLLSMDDTAEVAGGESIVIDTRPRGEAARTVRGPIRQGLIPLAEDPTRASWFGKLTSRQLWPLLPGRNQIDIFLAGAGSGSYVSLAYRDARLTP